MGRPLLLRFSALAAFLVTVALALWLAQVTPLFVGIVMAIALLLAWMVEWVAWREEHRPREEGEPTPEVEAAEPEPVPAMEAAPAPAPPPAAQPEPTRQPEPAAAPEPPSPPPLRPVPPPEPAAPEPPPPPLQPVPDLEPPPEPEPEPAPVEPAARAEPEPQRAPVVTLPRRAAQGREWNLWEIERLVRERLKDDPERLEESQFILLHLRSYANPDGSLPSEFDGLVRESFGAVLQRA